MVVGGHLDSDLGDGSHDDGTGCVQSMVLNIFKNMGYKPKTQSCVLFMNEENGVRGGKEYEISLTK
jgi:hypothetical protein